MKFCEKLLNLRKLNNMSQEQLADRLGVSRQAVSKWESGTSIPDMEKMMQLCKILNCNLDELVDDGAWGTSSNLKDDKITWNTYYREVLDFITKSINMFWSMRFVQKIKCLLEMCFLTMILYCIWAIVGNVIGSCFYSILSLLPEMLYHFIFSVSSFVYQIFGIIVGLILLVHIFKIRYLDYFITIEDANTIEKSIEKPIEENNYNDTSKFIWGNKNKIIIRDPKHSTYSFFGMLAKMIVLFIKVMLIFFAIPCIICFVLIAFLGLCSLWNIVNGMFFIGGFVAIIGVLLINYIILNMIYNFIFELKNSYRKIFIIFMIGLFLIGSGIGISFCSYLTFDKVSHEEKREITTFDEITYEDNLVLLFIEYDNVELIEDNDSTNIKVKVEHNKYLNAFLNYNNHFINEYDITNNIISNTYKVYHIRYDYENYIDEINNILNMIKDKKRFDDYGINNDAITIVASRDTLNKLRANYNKYNS